MVVRSLGREGRGGCRVPAAALALAAALTASLAGGGPARAEDCAGMLERVLARSDRLQAALRSLTAGDKMVDKASSAWFPQLELSGEYGSDREQTSTLTTNMVIRQLDMSVTQALWDLGKTDGAIDRSKAVRRQLEATLLKTRQDVLLEGLQTYVELRKAYRTRDFAQQSVENIRRQTGMEESRVEIGGGLPTDVLQAKSQLSGALARLVRANGALVAAINHYRIVYREEPPAFPHHLPELKVNPSVLPPDAEGAVQVAQDNNPDVLVARRSVDIADAEVQQTEGTELGPRLALVGDMRFGQNMYAVTGGKEERSIKLRMSIPFDTGLGGFAAVASARENAQAAFSRAADAQLQVEQLVRNAWQSYLTARENAAYLHNQERISGEFLRLAQQERLLGRRSLIDVLAGETSLINAQSDAAAADADTAIAAFTMLRLMGTLDAGRACVPPAS